MSGNQPDYGNADSRYTCDGIAKSIVVNDQSFLEIKAQGKGERNSSYIGLFIPWSETGGE